VRVRRSCSRGWPDIPEGRGGGGNADFAGALLGTIRASRHLVDGPASTCLSADPGPGPSFGGEHRPSEWGWRAVRLCSPCLWWWRRLCRRRFVAGGCARAVLVWGVVSRGYTNHYLELCAQLLWCELYDMK